MNDLSQCQFKLIVFDLDFTLWDAGGLWCDCTNPPYRIENDRVLDRANRHIRLYPDVMQILNLCDQASIPMALASRTGQPTWAYELLELFGIRGRFAQDQIFPASKLKHFNNLRLLSKIEYEDMLFFDDEMRNIDEVSTLGVTSIFVPDGIKLSLFLDAMKTS